MYIAAADRYYARFYALVPADSDTTGIAFMQFNTIYQLVAIKRENPAWLAQARSLLLMPDYLHYRLCGVQSCEYTNASTSQLLRRTGVAAPTPSACASSLASASAVCRRCRRARVTSMAMIRPRQWRRYGLMPGW